MSAEQQTAVLQEALDQSWWLRKWAALKHGMPDVQPRNVIKEAPLPQKIVEAVKPVVERVAAPASAPAPTVAPRKSSPWKAVALGTLLTVGGGAGGAFVASALKPAAPPVEQQATDQYGDLLLYLRENGYHVPPEVTP